LRSSHKLELGDLAPPRRSVLELRIRGEWGGRSHHLSPLLMMMGQVLPVEELNTA
jgi:hypothetical protein